MLLLYDTLVCNPEDPVDLYKNLLSLIDTSNLYVLRIIF